MYKDLHSYFAHFLKKKQKPEQEQHTLDNIYFEDEADDQEDILQVQDRGRNSPVFNANSMENLESPLSQNSNL